jgi:hypothetical protein
VLIQSGSEHGRQGPAEDLRLLSGAWPEGGWVGYVRLRTKQSSAPGLLSVRLATPVSRIFSLPVRNYVCGSRRLSRRHWEAPLQASDRYQEQAIRCLRLAQALDHEPSKALLLDMAQQWVKLADQARQRERPREEAGRSGSMPQHPEHMTSQ